MARRAPIERTRLIDHPIGTAVRIRIALRPAWYLITGRAGVDGPRLVRAMRIAPTDPAWITGLGSITTAPAFSTVYASCKPERVDDERKRDEVIDPLLRTSDDGELFARFAWERD